MRLARIAAVGLASALVAASCGGDGTTSTSGTAAGSVAVLESSTSLTSSASTAATADAAASADTASPTTADAAITVPAPTAPTATPSTVAAVTTSPPTTVAPCPIAAWTADVAGRAVLVRQPSATAPLPVVVAIHGYKGTPEGLEYYSELSSALIGDAAAIVVYPSGSPLDLGFGWNSGAGRFATSGVDDVAIIDQVVAFASSLPCADATNVFLAGESNGGGMALRAACDPRLAGRVAGLWLVNAAVDDGVLATCDVVDPAVPVLATVGLLDRVVPVDGSRAPFVAVDRWFAEVSAQVGGCDTEVSTVGAVGDLVEVRSAGACTACATLYVVADGPHTWPGSFEGINGSVPGSFEFTELVRGVVSGAADRCGSGR